MPVDKKIDLVQRTADKKWVILTFDDGSKWKMAAGNFDNTKHKVGAMYSVDESDASHYKGKITSPPTTTSPPPTTTPPPTNTTSPPVNTTVKPGTTSNTNLPTSNAVPPDDIKDYFTVRDGRYRLHVPANTPYDELVKISNWLETENENNYKRITQGHTSGQSDIYYGGLGPEDYEYKFAVGSYGQEAADEMSPQERRDAYFGHLGVDDQYLGSDANIYDDPTFRKHYYEKYKSKLPEGEYRQQLGDDFKFGFEHWKNIPVQIKEKPPVKLDTEPETKPEPCPEGYFRNSMTGECELIVPEAAFEYEDPGDPHKYFAPDIMNLGVAVMDNVKRFYPRLKQVDLEPPGVGYLDYTTAVANQHNNAQQLLNFIENNVSAGQQGVGLAATALGDSLNKTTQIIADTQNKNIGIYNQHQRDVSGIQNQQTMFNENALTEYQDKVNQVEQHYLDEIDAKNANIAKMYGQMWKNEAKASMLEQQYPNARRKDRWDASAFAGPLEGWRDITNPYDTGVTSYGDLANPNTSLESMQKQVSEMVKSGYSRQEAIDLIKASNRGAYSNSNRKRNQQGNPYGYMQEEGGEVPKFGVYLTGGIFE
jgi:hypothetical protein